MKFQYAFQKLVDLKGNEKSQAEWLLSNAVNQLIEKETNLNYLSNHHSRIHQEMIESAAVPTSISHLIQKQSYLDHLSRKINTTHLDVLHAKQEVSHKQNHLTDKLIEEKIWNKAREKAHLNHRSLASIKEQNEQDEMTSMRRK